MSAAIQLGVLVLGLVLSALAGPWVLRRAAPALMRAPRTAIALLLGVVIVWILALLAVGPLLAWVVTGPVVIPAESAEVCRRCIAAASSSSVPLVSTFVPVLAFVGVPALAAVGYGISASLDGRRRARATQRSAMQLRARGVVREVHGRSVLVTEDRFPLALSLSRRHGGVVVSAGTLDLLAADEIAAVLAHEDAHVRQRHHLIDAVSAGLTRRLRWVPLLAAASDALKHYLEIAADEAARRATGTHALASALLCLGQRAPAAPHAAPEGALHAAGPDRIGHLVRPASGTAGVLSTVAAACCLAGLAAASFSVYLPYALAALSGCP